MQIKYNSKFVLIYLQMLADKQFHFGTYNAIKKRLAKPNAGDTYLLRFAFDSTKMNFMRFLFAGRKVRGTCHADDCNYIFKNCITPRLSESSPEFKTVDRFVRNSIYIN